MKHLIPEHKDDQEKIKLLKEQPFEKLIPIIPDLIGWLADGNWPISKPISELLNPHLNKISYHYLEILNGNDQEWKYFLIHSICNMAKDKIPNEILVKIESIANSPSKQEIEAEVNEIAEFLLE